MGNGRFLQPTLYYDKGINLVNALEGYSLWQVLMQLAGNLIQEFDGTNREATIPWLDHVEAIARKMGFSPLEVSMSKLKGTTFFNVRWVMSCIYSYINCSKNYSNIA